MKAKEFFKNLSGIRDYGGNYDKTYNCTYVS